ncbi:hypothetical protein B0H12DRAFT_1145892 [Mycena haematopus]|nr:hypothetical protein B0H12DRAFT_1145892 [Mycena haematopus]
MRAPRRRRPATPPTTPPAMAAVWLADAAAVCAGAVMVVPGGMVEVTWRVLVTTTPLELVERTVDCPTVTDGVDSTVLLCERLDDEEPTTLAELPLALVLPLLTLLALLLLALALLLCDKLKGLEGNKPDSDEEKIGGEGAPVSIALVLLSGAGTEAGAGVALDEEDIVLLRARVGARSSQE